MAGYSPRTLREKLGIKPGHTITFVNQPEDYYKLLAPLPQQTLIALLDEGPFDCIQCFSTDHAELVSLFPILKNKLKQSGMLWISWPKGSSGMKTDLNENSIREIGLANGLVDVKVIAIDETWSGLKFVYRLKDRSV